MPPTLNSPVVVYTAASNQDAQLIAVLLTDDGIDAVAIDDVSMVGLHTFGTLPGIHRPKVYVDESNVEHAKEFLMEFESKARTSPSELYCYHCGVELGLGERQLAQCPACDETLEWDQQEDEPLEMAYDNLSVRLVAGVLLLPVLYITVVVIESLFRNMLDAW